MQLTIRFQKLYDDAQLPSYETLGAAGADVRAYVTDPLESHPVSLYIMEPGETKVFGTGLNIDIPNGYEVQVRPRSGLAARHGITVLNAPGTIDSDYKKELGIILHNSSNCHFPVRHGDRIAQIVVAPVIQAQFVEVEEIEQNGRGGFGSTGSK